ncbi:MAG: hypothetical protein ACOX6D_00430 [Thermoguttaceae bacterium]
MIEAEHSAHLKNLKKRIVGNLSGGTDVDHDAVLSSWQADYPAIPKTTRGIGVPHFDIEDESAFLKHRLKITVRTWNRSLGKILYRKNHDIPEADFCGRVLVLTQTSSGQNQKGIG